MTDNYYVKGALSGMFGICLSHPVDTIKTYYQTQKVMQYSFKNLYKGISAPLIGVGIEKGLVFGTYNYCKNTAQLPIPVSGAISGLVASVVVSPYERIKILKQTGQKPKFNTLFKGLGITFTREVPGFAIYFKVYEELRNYFYGINAPPIYASFMFGGIAGSMSWVFIYPQDRIKTIIQSNTNINTNLNIFNLYKGFSFALARAFLLHSGTFCMMEYLNSKY